nr:CAP-Gly domain-containing linker protein 1-like [Ipomoea batatas]GME14001.1 CAP-Gly domain-containing linker protein 1-like [Ipomoea batatas]GME17942.1 CAP-Gly domain-containing linker protein 1-like [Ipomoea batatas]
MDDSGAILCQISQLKDMLDKVNEEIEANIQITREIESEIVKCTETEVALLARQSELMKTAYTLQFEISGLMAATADSATSYKSLEEELHCLERKRDEILTRMNSKREGFLRSCLDFQNSIGKKGNDEVAALLVEKELLENEVHSLNIRNTVLQNSTAAFVEEVLEDLHNSIYVAERSVHMKKMMMQRDSESMGGVKKKVLSKSVGVYFKEQKEWFEYFVKVLLELPQD